MFGIGLGEIIVILFVAFLINPREIPKMMRKIADFFTALRQMKEELMQMQDDVEEVLKDGKIDTRSMNEDLQSELRGRYMKGRSDNQNRKVQKRQAEQNKDTNISEGNIDRT